MRDINRIEPFLEKIGDIWKKKCPDWRFGQLIYNFISEIGDPFYLEEEDFIKALEKYFAPEPKKEE